MTNGGSAPRMLCLDDYFMTEIEKTETDPESGKKITKMVSICQQNEKNSECEFKVIPRIPYLRQNPGFKKEKIQLHLNVFYRKIY